MKKILLLAMALLVPAFIFLNAWQGYKFHVMRDQITALENTQKELLEANMSVIARIAYERSPERVEQKAVQLGLLPIDASRVTSVVTGSEGAQAQ